MSKYGKILSLICFLDLSLTCLMIKLGIVTEANPILRHAYDTGGLVLLSFIKITINFFCVFLIEIAYHKKMIARKKIINYYKFTIIAYLLILFIGVTPPINSML